MSVNHRDREFWNQEAVEREYQRVFDVCNGCRLCFNLCPSFETLLTTIDHKDAEVENLDADDYRKVVDLCYHCKLCYQACPYTPPHRWAIDFPRLMLRGKMVNARTEGISFRDRILGNTDLVGKLGSAMAPLANWANTKTAPRLVLQGVLGIHPDRNLPPFQGETFQTWYAKHASQPRPAPRANQGRVALFYSCSVNYNNPEIGRATVQVLERNGIELLIPPQKCCGMPFLDSGDLKSTLEHVEFNLRQLNQAVEQGYDVISPGPTCSMMLKQEYPTLSHKAVAEKVSKRTYDVCEYLMKLHQRGKLDTNFAHPGGTVAYHLPCHLRAQNMGYKSRDVLQLIPNTKVQTIEQCSAHDGSWSAKREFYQLSLKWGEKLFNRVNHANADVVASDCPLAGLQITKGTHRKPVHPIEIVAKAYGFNADEEPAVQHSRE